MAATNNYIWLAVGAIAVLAIANSSQPDIAELRPMFGFTILDYAVAAPWNDPNFIGL